MILAFDTATDKLTAAIGTDKKVIAEIDMMAPRGHMERLLPAIENMLEEVKVELNEIDAIAVGLGPGSFTGVRIGVSTARGLAQGLNKKIVGIPTSDSIAWGLDWEGKIACLLDAKRGEMYSVIYDKCGPEEIRRITAFDIVTPDSFCEIAHEMEDDLILTGDALSPYGDYLRNRFGPNLQFADPDYWYPKACSQVELASRQWSGKYEGLENIEPIYGRLSHAEEVLNRKETDKTALFILETMTLADIGDVLEIEKNLFVSPWSEWMFKAEIESDRSFCLLARSGENIVGYAVLNCFEKEGHLMNLAVTENYQHKGIGSVLTCKLIEKAISNGVRRLTLEVRPSNVYARRLYGKFGFQELGVRKKYYAETNENGLILWTGDITFQNFQERLRKIEADLKRKLQVLDKTDLSS